MSAKLKTFEVGLRNILSRIVTNSSMKFAVLLKWTDVICSHLQWFAVFRQTLARGKNGTALCNHSMHDKIVVHGMIT